MRGFNSISLIGNVGSEPEMRYTPNSTAVTDFRFAVNRQWTDAEEEVHEEVEWFSVTAWSNLAETVNEYVKKGDPLFVQGRFSSREWEGRDGGMRTSLEVSASQIIFLSPPPDAEEGEVGEGETLPEATERKKREGRRAAPKRQRVSKTA